MIQISVYVWYGSVETEYTLTASIKITQKLSINVLLQMEFLSILEDKCWRTRNLIPRLHQDVLGQFCAKLIWCRFKIQFRRVIELSSPKI